MRTQRRLARSRVCMAVALLATVVCTSAVAQGLFGIRSIDGTYVATLDGAFSSAPPPFTGERLKFDAALVGLFKFDGAGQMSGIFTLTFHNPALPFAVRSRTAIHGTYSVAADGYLVIEAEEFGLDASGTPSPTRDNSVTYECYIAERNTLANCVLHSLITYQQGPEPVVLPVTMSGTLRRQH